MYDYNSSFEQLPVYHTQNALSKLYKFYVSQTLGFQAIRFMLDTTRARR